MLNKILGLVVIVLIVIYFIIPVKEINISEPSKVMIQVNLKNNNQEQIMSLNDYLIGVVGAEMPASFFMEALKAQAIASRTYALNNLNDNLITTNTSEQAFLNNDELKSKWQDKYEEYYDKIVDAIKSTDNLVMTYDNKIIKAYYYAMSNGYSETALNVFAEDLPYLNIVDSSFDKNNKNYEVTIKINKEEFCQKLDITCSNIIISNIKNDKSNRVISLDINNQTYQGITIRKILNLRSTDFTIIVNNEYVSITTKGYGHGVGMSQYGANYLAKEGYSYEDILKYYYQNVEITYF
jgi:stage II sporulation protein D